jgi:hypothetical protein
LLDVLFLQGFLVIDSFFDRSELDLGQQAVNDLVDELANKLYDAGKIKSKTYLMLFL